MKKKVVDRWRSRGATATSLVASYLRRSAEALRSSAPAISLSTADDFSAAADLLQAAARAPRRRLDPGLSDADLASALEAYAGRGSNRMSDPAPETREGRLAVLRSALRGGINEAREGALRLAAAAHQLEDELNGWEAVFGQTMPEAAARRVAALERVAAHAAALFRAIDGANAPPERDDLGAALLDARLIDAFGRRTRALDELRHRVGEASASPERPVTSYDEVAVAALRFLTVTAPNVGPIQRAALAEALERAGLYRRVDDVATELYADLVQRLDDEALGAAARQAREDATLDAMGR